MDRRQFIKSATAAGLGVAAANALAQTEDQRRYRPRATGKSAIDLAAPKMDVVRCAFIGTGARGPSHIDAVMNCEGTQVVAVCDTHEPSRNKAVKMVTDKGLPAPAAYGKDDYDYRRMLERDDIDAVFISTPWEWHVPMAVDTMKAGKHAFLEVPAAYTIDGCWELVDTCERTQKHCMMMENVNYGREELMVLNMCRMGLFGELLHGEAAYIHDLRWQMKEIEHGTGSWRTLHYARRNGNLYPTHGLGPVAHYMDINRGDRLDFLSSVSCNARSREIYAQKEFPEGHERRKLKFVCGDLNTTIARTVKGKTLMIQWDEQLPRPYTRHNLVQGTKGCFGGFPGRVVIEGKTPSTESWVQGAGLNEFYQKYDHPLWVKLQEEAKRHGGHGGMDFVMVWRIIYNLRNGRPMDQDVYDGAVWSVITPLSEMSVANRGRAYDVPDFTRGKWVGRKSVSLLD